MDGETILRLAAGALALGLTACESVPPASGGIPSALYRYAGSKQCEPTGKTLDALMKDLSAAGVQVQAASCGRDGRMYAQSCGMPDGRILVVHVAQRHTAEASRLGLAPLRELPEAVAVPCP